ncbi:fluoride efflux transporter CrcB [Neobacillus sp. LXY-4]|uniref:fluoride efflux transporter CrcB n=1 Tax=Neobacillus sp. LXY-4 TaxID=3379826 RepID=UPI003EE106E0
MIWLIGFGGSFGAGFRFLIGNWIIKKTTTKFPYSTLIINLIGSFILGLLVNLHRAEVIADTGYFFFGIGFCGAFTTFSTFANEVVFILLEKRWRVAFLYIVLSIVLALMGASVGLIL